METEPSTLNMHCSEGRAEDSSVDPPGSLGSFYYTIEHGISLDRLCEVAVRGWGE